MKLETYIRDNTTVTAFAKRIKRSRAQVHRYIRGENLTKGIIEEICEATGGQVQPADFFAEREVAA
ncbi:helix-turn-helix domain-containing protein [Paradevosia shaoguanensis]|uniref:helix-turn-helix domain-containing protein n=1 Tax=Paradevosia shaoguanensis TaxID=1335043 RepID=UPI001931A121|nr:helix-turn-helix domain-containing protein [Paradevosia shaoguanensis]